MTQPRANIISLEATPYYHCISRCVRRAFLCGDDQYSGLNFDHRKPWIIKRLNLLCQAFSIDIAAYAIMSNHYHLVLHVDKNRSENWSKNEVIQHWLKLYKGPEIVHRYLRGEFQHQIEINLLEQQVEVWRKRLCSISWFMACMNQYVARKANKEDNCKGRFWESRFKSQALLDEAALLSCMVYVDLNPIRAGISKDLKSSSFTSIKQRITNLMQPIEESKPRLMSLSKSNKSHDSSNIPFSLKSYIELADWTGRCARHDKPGYIHEESPPLITALGISNEQWKYLSLDIQKQSFSMLNGLEKLVTWKNKNKIG